MARFELSEADRAAITSGVSCALLLERYGFALDKKDSTRNSLKYRRGKGETYIVSHQGKGWWDTGSQAKGNVFDLVKHFEPTLRWQDVCVDLGKMVGVEPASTPWVKSHEASTDVRSPAERWAKAKSLRKGSKAWQYLAQTRCLPEWLLRKASANGSIRDGFHAAWFSYRDGQGAVTGVELRGPDTRLQLKDSVKTLFRFQTRPGTPVRRLVVAEAPIDALSFAAMDPEHGNDTLYVATGGGMGPETIAALETEMEAMVPDMRSHLIVATDQDEAGDRYAGMLFELAFENCVRYVRAIPEGEAKDFNQALQERFAASNAARTVVA
ncbi:DUF3991 and toprim domain-containing protein [Asaia sp. As-1742]|uniref:DUF3991 and toprim domain-containing protein n=1 Tax=Asaia sp. As-1742 TaxID=2608325 RepID=UPI00141F2DE5|nr:DUF3991 and toprim domain-containing protein [Asaia sp. As-1742]NIE81406.1 DUF3991 domain-containing protein [Asaia sp. As-1742]